MTRTYRLLKSCCVADIGSWKQVLEKLKKLEGPRFYFYHSMFVFLTAKALHYYAPAFLIISLDPKADMVGDCFFSALEPQQEGDYFFPRFAELMQLFSDRQKQAVALAIASRRGESEALRRYWSQWLPS